MITYMDSVGLTSKEENSVDRRNIAKMLSTANKRCRKLSKRLWSAIPEKLKSWADETFNNEKCFHHDLFKSFGAQVILLEGEGEIKSFTMVFSPEEIKNLGFKSTRDLVTCLTRLNRSWANVLVIKPLIVGSGKQKRYLTVRIYWTKPIMVK